MVITSSGIPLSQIFASKVICILKNVHHDAVGILVTSEGSWSIYRFITLVFLMNTLSIECILWDCSCGNAFASSI